MNEAAMDDFMTQDSGPYVLAFPDGSRETVVDTRQEVWDMLDAMDDATRRRIRVEVGWNDDSGDYVYEMLRMEVENPV